jgi:hypothetical protein
MNKIGNEIYKLLNNNNNNEILDIININGLNNLLLHNGCLSNLLIYYINNNDNDKINYILTKTNLMKRDYLNITKYYYEIDFDKSLMSFRNINYNNLEIKDIDFLIKNSLRKIFYELEEIFIKTTLNYNNYKLPYKKLQIKNNNYINIIEKIFTDNILNELNKIKLDYNYIIDAGNILYSDKGKINITGLEKIINKCNNSIIIIHKKHLKNNIIKNIINKYHYYETPYTFYDDLFILWFFLKKHSYIITNDKFRDHNYNYNLKYNYNILLQYIINYTKEYELINNEHNFIRIENNNIYIPFINGNYLLF